MAAAKSVFSIIGGIVVLILLVIVFYFAWIGWNARGQPRPDVDVQREAPITEPAPATPVD